MNEDEEYDSDNSDSTVLLTDFVDNPQKVDVKRRRLSNLHDRGNQTNEFDDENTAPGDASARRTGNSPEKKRRDVDKNWHITKYFAYINKNNDTNIKNNDAKCLQNLDLNGKQVRRDIKIKQAKIKGNSTNNDSDEIICLDSDDETQIDDNSRDQDVKSVEISAASNCINNQNLVHKPARLTTRRATTDIIEQNKTPQTEENKYPKLRVLKPHTINSRRATTHFEEKNLTSNVIGKTTSIPKRTYTENVNEIESNGYRSTPRLSVAQSADVDVSSDADCNNIVLRTTAGHNNTRTSTLATSIQPLKMDIDKNNGLINKGPRQDTNVFLNVNTHKRCGSNNEMQTEPKRIKVDAKSIETAEFNKNTPNNDFKSTALKESERLESSEPYVDVRNEMHIMSTEHSIHDGVGNEKSNGSNASESINTTGPINEKRASVNTIHAKTKSTVMCDKTTPNTTKISSLTGLLHKIEASKMCVNLTAHKNKAANYRIERSDGSVVNENSMPIVKTFKNDCQNRGTSEASIIQDTHESRDKKETTKVQDLINKLQNKQMPTKVIDNQETSNVQAALDGSESLDKFGTSIERETSQIHDKQETNKVQDDPETSKPSDVVHDKHEVSKVQRGFKINETYEKHETNETLVKTVPNQTRHEQETGNIIDKGNSSDKQELNKAQEDQVTREAKEPESNKVQDNHVTCKHQASDNADFRKKQTEAGKISAKGNSSDKQELNIAQGDQVTGEAKEPETNRVQDNHKTCKRQISDNADIRKKQTETVTSNTLDEKEPSQLLDMTIVGETNDEQEKAKVYDQLQTNNLQVEQIPKEALDKQVRTLGETSEAENVQVEITGRENNVMEIQHVQEAQEVSNANKTIGFTNVQETVKKNEATSRASRDAHEDNVFLLKFHVDFFTEVKKYLKDTFPESAMQLHHIIETLRYRIVDAKNGQVETDVKYGCPNCSRVSNYSTRILNNEENEENKTNADGSQTCGFCNGIRKLYISYLKKFLAKKNSVNEKKEDVKMVSLRKDHPTSVEQSINSSVGETVTGNSEMATEVKTDNNLAPASAAENSNCSSIIKNDKQVGNHALDRKGNNHLAQKRPVPTINISQLDVCSTIDNNVNKAVINTTTPPVVSETDATKVSDQDTPVTKDNLDNFDEEASSKTDLGVKRKSDITYKEATDPKLIKTNTEETYRQSVENLTEVNQTSNQQNETLRNERRNKIQILSDITSSRTASNLQSDTEVNRAANSEPCNDVIMNTPEKSSNECTKAVQTNTTHQNTHDACLNPKPNTDNIITAEVEELNKSKYSSEDNNQTIDSKSNENINKERQGDVDQNGKEKASYSTSTGSILETNEANVNEVTNIEENYQGNGDVLKPLMDCFAKLRTSVKEKKDTPMKDQGNVTLPESTSKIRPTIRGSRSNSLDNLQNRDNKKIVMKYVCPTCNCMYMYPFKLLRHIQERHNPSLTTITDNCYTMLQCPYCNALLPNKNYNYNNHVKRNHPEKWNENFGDVENSNNTLKCENEKHRAMKNKTFLNRGNTESTKSSESTKSEPHSIKNSTADDTTRQHKNQRRSEYKYQHLIRRIKITDVNNDKQDETLGDKNEELHPIESDTQHTSIGNESDSTVAASTGEITSIINNTLPHVNHTEWCCDESDKSAERPTAIHNEKERTPTDSNDLNLDTNEERHVRSLRKDDMHDTNETSHVENNYSKIYETEPVQSKASKESINKQIVDEKQSSGRVSNDECKESETAHGIDNGISITSANETLTATYTSKNGEQGSNDFSTRYINNGEQFTENTAIESTQICCSNINKKKETDSEDDCIKASDHTVKKRNERINKLFGDENEALVSSKIKASSELFACHKECQTPKDRTKKTERLRRNRKANVHKRRKVTVEQCTESAENSDTSDSDWIISNDECSDSSDSYDEFCTIKKQQVIRKLFTVSEKKLCLRNGTNDESSSESGENNDDEENEEEETIKSSRYTVMKKNERLSKLFGDDNELSVSNEISEEDDRQERSDKKAHRSERQCVEIEEDNKESAPSNNEHQVPSDDETLKVSEETIKKKQTRISNYFGDDDEALVQVQDSNQQMENSNMNNAGCLISTADDGRTTDVNLCSEETQCRVEITKMREHRINDKIYVNEISHQETSGRKSDVDGATDQNGIIAVAEEENMNAVRNESKSRDEDRIEINMIDGLLKEFASGAHQNGACATQENDNEVDRNAEINAERQATSQSAKVKNCLNHIRITNVTTIGGKTNVFICQECNYGTDAYDDAIRHCQNHYNLIDDPVTYCGICQINYDAVCFERHQSSHDKYLGNIKIKFSYHWLYTNWQVVLQKNNIALSETEDMQVKSIYKTFCVRMAVREDGPWQSAVYLCIKCNNCVPSSDIEKHVRQKCSSGNNLCSKCDRMFLTYELLKHHEIYHTDDASEIFKTIVFNDQNDESFNSKLRQVKAQSGEKPRIADIFKCLCGLCFISLKKFKLHFAYCDTELDDGRQCLMCPRLFSTTELEEHTLLHHSSLNYEFRVQKITFQLEPIIDYSERETPLSSSNRTYNATQMSSNDEDLNIKTDMLQAESFTQSTVEENNRENVYNNDEEDIKSGQINEPVPKTSDSITSQMGSNDDLIIKRDMLKAESLTQTTNEENRQEHVDTEEAIINRVKINEPVPKTSDSITENTLQMGSNDDLIIKRDMLKAESLTQTTDEENRQENVDTEEALINKAKIKEPVPKTSDSITENTSQMKSNDDLIIKRHMLKAESLTQTTDEENRQENVDTEEAIINKAKINDAVPGTSGSTTDTEITLNEKGLNINGDIERLKQRASGENGLENIGNTNVEMEDVDRGLINETGHQNNYEDMIIKKDMLKDENLTQNTNEENSQEILDTDEKEDITIKGDSQGVSAIEDPENLVDAEASEEAMVVEQSANPINIEDSQEINETHGGPITIDGSQEMEVEESTHLITIEDSDEDVEFISGSFPDTTKIFPLSYNFKR